MKDFQPISLCNVLYKIISKVLANGLKPIIPNCISKEQSVFMQDRSILDNVIVASKIIHHMRGKRKGKTGEMALKIDISKAFDDWLRISTSVICLKQILKTRNCCIRHLFLIMNNGTIVTSKGRDVVCRFPSFGRRVKELGV